MLVNERINRDNLESFLQSIINHIETEFKKCNESFRINSKLLKNDAFSDFYFKIRAFCDSKTENVFLFIASVNNVLLHHWQKIEQNITSFLHLGSIESTQRFILELKYNLLVYKYFDLFCSGIYLYNKEILKEYSFEKKYFTLLYEFTSKNRSFWNILLQSITDNSYTVRSLYLKLFINNVGRAEKDLLLECKNSAGRQHDHTEFLHSVVKYEPLLADAYASYVDDLTFAANLIKFDGEGKKKLINEYLSAVETFYNKESLLEIDRLTLNQCKLIVELVTTFERLVFNKLQSSSEFLSPDLSDKLISIFCSNFIKYQTKNLCLTLAKIIINLNDVVDVNFLTEEARSIMILFANIMPDSQLTLLNEFFSCLFKSIRQEKLTDNITDYCVIDNCSLICKLLLFLNLCCVHTTLNKRLFAKSVILRLLLAADLTEEAQIIQIVCQFYSIKFINELSPDLTDFHNTMHQFSAILKFLSYTSDITFFYIYYLCSRALAYHCTRTTDINIINIKLGKEIDNFVEVFCSNGNCTNRVAMRMVVTELLNSIPYQTFYKRPYQFIQYVSFLSFYKLFFANPDCTSFSYNLSLVLDSINVKDQKKITALLDLLHLVCISYRSVMIITPKFYLSTFIQVAKSSEERCYFSSDNMNIMNDLCESNFIELHQENYKLKDSFFLNQTVAISFPFSYFRLNNKNDNIKSLIFGTKCSLSFINDTTRIDALVMSIIKKHRSVQLKAIIELIPLKQFSESAISDSLTRLQENGYIKLTNTNRDVSYVIA